LLLVALFFLFFVANSDHRRLILQRVLRGTVTVGGKLISSIGKGLVVLVGIHSADTATDADALVSKILNARLWPDGDRPWQKSVSELGYDVLVVSQFTLYGTLQKGRKPDFHVAMPPTQAKEFYASFVAAVRKAYLGGSERVKDGEFGAMMEVELVNDGPVTLQIDSRKDEDN